MDEKAFVENVISNLPLMKRTAMSILHNEMDSEDAVSETLFRCWQCLGSLRDERKIRPWLLRSVTNRSLDMLRKAGRERLLIDALEKYPGTCAECDPFLLLEVREMLAAAIDERACLFLHDWKGYTLSEIANFMNMPISTVKARLYRARRNVLSMWTSNFTARRSLMGDQ